MTKDVIQGNWKQLTGKIKEKWGKLTDDEITQTKGSLEQLAGKIQEKYGYEKDKIKNDLNNFIKENKGDE